MNKDALTAPEVAEILKVAQNTVYELVKRGELNCYKIGRKMRFTYEDVQEYINRSRNTARGLAEKHPAEQDYSGEKQSAEKIYIGQKEIKPSAASSVAGSKHMKHAVFKLCGHDEILDVLAKYMNVQSPNIRIERLHKGSYDSLVALYKDEVIAAASHMWDARTNSYNYPYITKMLPGCRVVAVRVANRSEGFYVAAGNPKNITSWDDLRRSDLVIANREPGAGTRILLDEHLQILGIPGSHLQGYGITHLSHMSVAGSISRGEADFGIGTEKTALNTRGVDFIPLQMEHYDLIVKKENFQDERIQLMLRILQSGEFREQFSYMNGYDVSEMGKVLEPDVF